MKNGIRGTIRTDDECAQVQEVLQKWSDGIPHEITSHDGHVVTIDGSRIEVGTGLLSICGKTIVEIHLSNPLAQIKTKVSRLIWSLRDDQYIAKVKGSKWSVRSRRFDGQDTHPYRQPSKLLGKIIDEM